MIELRQSETFRKWLTTVSDKRLRLAIAARLDRLTYGNAGDARPVGMGISELRIEYGPGYRIYFKRRGDAVFVVLCGGDKSSQAKDIAMAKRLVEEWSNEGA